MTTPTAPERGGEKETMTPEFLAEMRAEHQRIGRERRELEAAGSGAPRRIDMLRWTPAERAIHAAIEAVEAAGADVRLTDAVILLSQAQGKVADYVDGIDR
jgi:hypothetical protein